jgi:SAM-dependent methyltransferase
VGRRGVEHRYRRHHEERREDGFVFCGPERLPLFAEWVGGPGLRVLDLGCRDGALTSAYLAGNDVVGVDADREALARAAERGIETVWADLEEGLPFEDASFDVVVLGEVLEHLRFPEQLLAEVARVLVPGGKVVGSVPNGFRLKTRLRFLLGRPPENDPTLLHLLAPADVGRLLDGFHEVETRCIAGRLVRLHRRLFANDIAFRARKPGPATVLQPRHAGRSRERILGLTALALLYVVLLFVALPESLGDWPYNVLGR